MDLRLDRTMREFRSRGSLQALALAGLLALSACGSAETSGAPEPTSTQASSTAGASTTTTVVPTTTAAPTTTVAPATTAAPTTTVAPTTAVPTTTQPEYEGEPITVTRVIDGDTVDLTTGETVRLLGFDTPERGECGYDDAANALRYMLSAGFVTMTSDVGDDTDRYGRILRHILVLGVPLGLTMIENGFANARYDSLDGYPRHRYQDQYRSADGSNTFVCAPVAPLPAAPLTNVYYANCDAVRAAGAAPIRAGDPGFQQKFDRDNDGIGCE
jgi:endonuclease YncB( thermonuclease family)